MWIKPTFRRRYKEACEEWLLQSFQGLTVNKEDDVEAQILSAACFPPWARPVALPASQESSYKPRDEAFAPGAVPDQSDPAWPAQTLWSWGAELPPRPRSGSATAGSRAEAGGLSSRYKTELCRAFEESGACKYGAKCQYAHGVPELRELSRHPRYKTEPCRTFHTAGICPYGARCHFIHNPEERRPPPPRHPQPLPPSFEALPSPRPPRAAPGSLPGPAGALLPQLLGRPPHGRLLGSAGPFGFPSLFVLQKSVSADSLSDQEDSGSSGRSSGSESPGLGPAARRLPIFSQLSISDD
ncbi:mRNA decay activator protein ZFP36L1-like [Varanus komodoensis]|uniref:mRNA decay activator protein ZFP36L1-like n=1 Tax=Varanus komodoensis TaxID=61221 RepID=UPI001CF7E3DC|nr:mRNA decay activator protein ZFP36L1-like [Varanus komodoensis]XP_044291411.1 mRNA decay activator protein ZFP36L1-like [Varanus komodoensis]